MSQILTFHEAVKPVLAKARSQGLLSPSALAVIDSELEEARSTITAFRLDGRSVDFVDSFLAANAALVETVSKAALTSTEADLLRFEDVYVQAAVAGWHAIRDHYAILAADRAKMVGWPFNNDRFFIAWRPEHVTPLYVMSPHGYRWALFASDGDSFTCVGWSPAIRMHLAMRQAKVLAPDAASHTVVPATQAVNSLPEVNEAARRRG